MASARRYCCRLGIPRAQASQTRSATHTCAVCSARAEYNRLRAPISGSMLVARTRTRTRNKNARQQVKQTYRASTIGSFLAAQRRQRRSRLIASAARSLLSLRPQTSQTPLPTQQTSDAARCGPHCKSLSSILLSLSLLRDGIPRDAIETSCLSLVKTINLAHERARALC